MLPCFLPAPCRMRVRPRYVSLLPLLALLLSTRLCPGASASGVVTQPTEAALVAAMQGGGVVTFACDGVIPITSTKNIGPGSAADGTSNLTLDATGHNITLDGGGQVQLLNVHTTQTQTGYTPYALTLKHLTMANGMANQPLSSDGGAIFAGSGTTLNVDACMFVNNKAAYGGGAIFITGTFSISVAITNSIFTSNQVDTGLGTASPASVAGGAVVISTNNYNTTPVTFTNCAFLNNSVTAGQNSSAIGGAMRVFAPVVAFTNCTYIGNRATSTGTNVNYHGAIGGAISCAPLNAISATSSFVLLNCTIANNAVMDALTDKGYGGGLYFETSQQGVLTLTNTIVANNTAVTAGNNSSTGDSRVAITDGGHNICSDATCAFTSATSKNSVNPLLGPLVYTGGATPTLSLLAGSPAIDAGDDTAAPTTDQRGAARQGAHSDIGAYERPVWQADATATAPDGTTRLLWNRGDGLANLWSVDASSNAVQSYDYGPFPGWTAVSASVGPDNNTYLLWINADGRANVWEVDTRRATGQVLASGNYGPFAGWTAAGMSVSADGAVRLLWRNVDGRADLWSLNLSNSSVLSSFHYGPFSGYAVQSLSAGTNGSAWLLWNRVDGLSNLWQTDINGNVARSFNYGPFAGWNASRVAVGGDNNPRLLWNHYDGLNNLWTVDRQSGNAAQSFNYGPFTGFSLGGLSVGSDNNPRLLWNHYDGLLDLWSINGSGSLLSSFHYGPF